MYLNMKVDLKLVRVKCSLICCGLRKSIELNDSSCFFICMVCTTTRVVLKIVEVARNIEANALIGLLFASNCESLEILRCVLLTLLCSVFAYTNKFKV